MMATNSFKDGHANTGPDLALATVVAVTATFFYRFSSEFILKISA